MYTRKKKKRIKKKERKKERKKKKKEKGKKERCIVNSLPVTIIFEFVDYNIRNSKRFFFFISKINRKMQL